MTIFQTKAPRFIVRAMQDLSCDLDTACAIFGNVGHECSGFQTMQEIGQKAPNGGWGWLQWTGPRRRQFMAWCTDKKMDPASDEANYGYLIYETLNLEHASLVATKNAVGLDAKTDKFEQTNERAGVPALASRRNWAHIAKAAYLAAGQPAPAATPAAPAPVQPRKPAPPVPPAQKAAGAVAGAVVVAAGGAVSTGHPWLWVAAAVAVIIVTVAILIIRKGTSK